jgi:hypothetical protein
MISQRLTLGAVLLVAVGLLMGCSGSSAAWTGLRAGKNLSKKDSHLKIMLDGEAAKQSTVKKAATGYARFEVPEPVSTTPALKFEIEDPDKFGRITMVSVQIHQKFEADYSHHAEYTIVAEDVNEPAVQMKPGETYDLGDPRAGFKVMN